ncbi:MAG: hypothetical protein Q4C66_15965 [Lachnospiraceae bacterium]|nr:hypothetical protein [Lachnospiraceae bacterium]
MKILRTIALGLSLALLMSASVQAGSLEGLRVIGIDKADQEVLEGIGRGLEGIPQEVLQHHRNTGKSVILTAGTLPGYDNAVAGLYFYSGPEKDNIYVRVDADYYNQYQIPPDITLTHEIGHFIYNRWHPSMGTEDQIQLEQLHDYWSRHRLDCYDPEETFAVLYSNCKIDPEWYDAETREFFRKAESYIIRLSQGPGAF